jgi:hypothetical protein
MAENSYSFKNPFKKTDIILKEKKEASQLSFDICNIVSALLTDICEEGKHNIESKIALLKPFISRKIPTISIKDFIDRLLKYSKAFKEIIIIILIYLDNICAKNKINLNYYNIHKLIFGAFISAVKFYEDHLYSMKYYAKLGGISLKEALVLEYEFMSLIDFKLFVNQEVYDKYYNYLYDLENDINDELEIDLN